MNQNSNPKNDQDSNSLRSVQKPVQRSVKPETPKRRLRGKPRILEPVLVQDAEAEPLTRWQKIRQQLNTFCGPILSFLVHAMLLLLLAFFVFSKQEIGPLGVVAEITASEEVVDSPPQDLQHTIEINVDTEIDQNQSDIEAESVDNSLSDNTTLPTITNTDDTETESDNSTIENDATLVPESNATIGGGLEGRQSGARANLASTHGGTPASELAVENGLRWLANHQFPNGSWRLDFRQGPCQGRCRNPAPRETTTAATGLSLLAFLGAGYTHKNGPYQQQVQDGLDYLVSRIRKSIYGGNLMEGTMYAQGIATVALCEAYSMTGDSKLKEPIESCMQYIVTAQHSAGGWRYDPGQPGDINVTGWQMMALKSCEMAGVEVPAETIKKAKKFLRDVGDESKGLFGYQGPSKRPDPTSTAVGLLMQMYHGWSREHRGLEGGTKYLLKQGPSKNNIYFNYYATLALFHARHEKWDQWNQEMRDYLVSTQSTSGHESGSWHFKEKYGSTGGRLYTTAMAVMVLEVYYRYLPLFDSEPVSTKRR